jgi:ABC-type sugar transport system permease subunit
MSKAPHKERKAELRAQKQHKARIKSGRLARREAITGLTFVAPYLIGAAIFLVFTMGNSFWYALNNIRITPLGMNFLFVGTGNFTQILVEDAEFPIQLIEYMTSTILSVPIIVVFALIIAMLLNGKIKMKGFFRLIFFLPVIVVSGPVMGMLTSQGASQLSTIDTVAISNTLYNFIPYWLVEEITDLFENMVLVLWYSGVQILIFLSALQKIDAGMYEAAKIDGGSGWECFWKITLPTIKPMILLNVIYTAVFISGNSTNSIIILIQRSMFSGTKEKGYGYASAMAWLYSLVVVLIVAIFSALLMTRKDVYERQIKKVKREMRCAARLERRTERRGVRNARKHEEAKRKGKYKSYDGSGDY